MPDGEYVVPIGKAKILREGEDVTLVSWSRMVFIAEEAADKLAVEGIHAEVIDLRTIVPFGRETVLNSVKKTGRLVVVHEAVEQCGFAAEIATVVMQEAFADLKAPVARVTAPNCPSPFSPVLEDAYLPNAEKVIKAVHGCMEYSK